jgi:exodeoxyribonuclease VII large subunit
MTNIPEYSVTELSGQLKRTIEDAYGYVRVRGELGRVIRAGSGHVYLDLKDDRAVLSSVMWKGTASRQKVKPEQGMEVVATGRLSTFPGQSRYQLIIDTLAPAGVGALMALYEERKKKLAAEGLFDPERKRPLPRVPRLIGVVTSPSGAVIRDILHRLRDRFPSHVIVWPTLVQGEQAAKGIVAGIKGLAALPEEKRPDLIIVARGGGSLEDLWCFNDEEVARAAAASPIPLISAVGHETDTTLIDFAADMRAPTPTAAAEMAVPVRSELLAQTGQLGLQLDRRLSSAMEAAALGLRSADRALGKPGRLTETPVQRFDIAAAALQRALQTGTERASMKIDQLTTRLQPALLFRPIERREAELVRRAGGLRPRLLRSQIGLEGERLRSTGGRLARSADGTLGRHRERLGNLRLRWETMARILRREQERVQQTGSRFNDLARDGLIRSEGQLSRTKLPSSLIGRNLAELSDRLQRSGRLLQSLSYERILERGFALVTTASGDLVTSVGQAKEEAVLNLAFADGDLEVRSHGTKRAKTEKPLPKKDQQTLF